MYDLRLEEGRPADLTGRTEAEIRCYDILDQLGIHYMRTDHPDAHADTMEACAAIDAVLESAVAKNLVLCNRQKTNYYLLIMPGDKVFKTKELSKQIGSARLSFASPEDMAELLGTHPGSASVLGLMNDKDHRVRLLIDRDIYESESIGCHPCINTSSLRISMADLLEKFLPYVEHEPTVVELVGEV